MKTIQVSTNNDTLRLAYYAERLQSLVQDARAEGIELAIPTHEPQRALAKVQKSTRYAKHELVLAVPRVFHHEFLGQPGYVTACAILDASLLSDPEKSRIVQSTRASSDAYSEPDQPTKT
jgi:hypothetical protein